MKDIIIKILKIVLLSALIIAVVFLLISGAIIMKRPWWFGLIITACLAALYPLFLLTKKLWGILKEKVFSKKHERYLKDIRTKWKDTVAKIKKSELKDKGNPLYVLPWYLILGQSGSGKTTVINNSGVSSAFIDSPAVSEITETMNCDWWFLENGIVMDAAGRYVSRINRKGELVEQDEWEYNKSEWNFFLNQLIKYRKKEQINGLIIAVSADQLLKSDIERIEKLGTSIRLCIEDLMLKIGAKFPIYILVTKCDLIKGMSRFCELLPKETYHQALGSLNEDFSIDFSDMVDKSIDNIVNRLRKIRLLISQYNQTDAVPPSAFFFTEELAKLKSGLKNFLKLVFQDNVYQETPMVRGIYFSSALQTGVSSSNILKDTSLKSEENLPDTSISLFIKDFFAKILPADRKLFNPTQRTVKKRNILRSLAFAAWICLFIVLSALLSSSYFRNMDLIRSANGYIAKPYKFTGKLAADINTLENLRQTITELEKQNNSTVIYNIGLTHGRKIERRLKDIYCNIFKKNFLVPSDKVLSDKIINFSKKTNTKVLGNYVPLLIRRINISDIIVQEKDYKILKKLPEPNYKYLISPSKEILSQSLFYFKNQYMSYIVWQDRNIIKKESEDLKSKLRYVVEPKNKIPLKWLTEWCNTEIDFIPYSLKDFWQGKDNKNKEIFIPSCFTSQGKENIEILIKELESALANPFIISKKKTEFYKWYKDAYMDRWFEFGDSFSAGKERLATRDDMTVIAMKIGTDHDPYLSLLNISFQQLSPFIESDDDIPVWIKLISDFNDVQITAAEMSETQGGNPAEKIGFLKKVKSKLAKAQKLGIGGSGNTKNIMEAAEAFNKYIEGILGIKKASVSPASAFEFTKEAYAENKESPVFIAEENMERLIESIIEPYSSSFSGKNTMVTNLIENSFRYIWNFANREANCHIQKLWEEMAFFKMYEVDREKIPELMFGESGYATAFINDPLKVFLDKNRGGYHSKRIIGERVPFTPEFLSFINKGDTSSKIIEESYKVSLDAMPTDINGEARVLPYQTLLTLQCASGTQTLKNQNYLVSKVFTWNPKTCGDVNIEINVGSIVLTKKYTGDMAFANFLRDFSNGSHTYNRREFGKRKSYELRNLDVENITVKYKLQGHKPVLKLLYMTPKKVPERIVYCALTYCENNSHCTY